MYNSLSQLESEEFNPRSHQKDNDQEEKLTDIGYSEVSTME